MDGSMKQLVKMMMTISLDGKSSLEALHDMLYVFYQISKAEIFVFCDPLFKSATEDMMTMLVGLSKSPVEDAPQFYAKGILSTLSLNRSCSEKIKTIEGRYQAGVGADAEDVLKAK